MGCTQSPTEPWSVRWLGQSVEGQEARPDWILVSHELHGVQAASKSAAHVSDTATCKGGLKRKQTKI